MRRIGTCVAIGVSIVLCGVAVRGDDRHDDGRNDRGESRVEQGFRISPVPVRVTRRNRELVGLGSYIVNAQGGAMIATPARSTRSILIRPEDVPAS
jgi:hypothetical protein